MKQAVALEQKNEVSLKIVSRSEDVIPLENQKIFRSLMVSLKRMSRHVEVSHLPVKEWTVALRNQANQLH